MVGLSDFINIPFALLDDLRQGHGIRIKVDALAHFELENEHVCNAFSRGYDGMAHRKNKAIRRRIPVGYEAEKHRLPDDRSSRHLFPQGRLDILVFIPKLQERIGREGKRRQNILGVASSQI
ncbi:hypothetical protein [Streptacidiphilus sp. PAMC 29251]